MDILAAAVEELLVGVDAEEQRALLLDSLGPRLKDAHQRALMGTLEDDAWRAGRRVLPPDGPPSRPHHRLLDRTTNSY